VITFDAATGVVNDSTANTVTFPVTAGSPTGTALARIAAAYPLTVALGNNAFVIGGAGGAGGSTINGTGGQGGSGGNAFLIIPNAVNYGVAGDTPWAAAAGAVASTVGNQQLNAGNAAIQGLTAPGTAGAALGATAAAAAGGPVARTAAASGAAAAIAAAGNVVIAIGGAGGLGGAVVGGGTGIAGSNGRGGSVSLSMPAGFSGTAIGGSGLAGAAGAPGN
jgi:hypothetical protein